MLSLQTIQPDTLELLKKLAAFPELRNTRLVGGTALALLYGHRQSIDLDFFGQLPWVVMKKAILREVDAYQQ